MLPTDTETSLEVVKIGAFRAVWELCGWRHTQSVLLRLLQIADCMQVEFSGMCRELSHGLSVVYFDSHVSARVKARSAH